MKRTRRPAGIIVTVASTSPEAAGTTLRLGPRQLALLRFAGTVALLVAVLAAPLLFARETRAEALEARIAELETALAGKESELQASLARVDEMNLVADELLTELGSLGARVREVQTFAGLEPDVELRVFAAEAYSASGRAAGASVGGPVNELPIGAVDALRVDLGELASFAHDDLDGLEASISEVHDTVAFQRSVEAATPRIWPVRGLISSYFGWRRSPIDGRTLMHQGLDIAAPYRTPVAATAPGEVAVAGWSTTGYGYHVIVDHGHGFRTLYAHLSEIEVTVGQAVDVGDPVGLLGNTGYSTGPHLHYEVWQRGVPADPAGFLPSD